eukprot:gene6017-1076_t
MGSSDSKHGRGGGNDEPSETPEERTKRQKPQLHCSPPDDVLGPFLPFLSESVRALARQTAGPLSRYRAYAGYRPASDPDAHTAATLVIPVGSITAAALCPPPLRAGGHVFGAYTKAPMRHAVVAVHCLHHHQQDDWSLTKDKHAAWMEYQALQCHGAEVKWAEKKGQEPPKVCTPGGHSAVCHL